MMVTLNFENNDRYSRISSFQYSNPRCQIFRVRGSQKTRRKARGFDTELRVLLLCHQISDGMSSGRTRSFDVSDGRMFIWWLNYWDPTVIYVTPGFSCTIESQILKFEYKSCPTRSSSVKSLFCFFLFQFLPVKAFIGIIFSKKKLFWLVSRWLSKTDFEITILGVPVSWSHVRTRRHRGQLVRQKWLKFKS